MTIPGVQIRTGVSLLRACLLSLLSRGTRYVRWCRGVGSRGLRTCLLSGSGAVGPAHGGWPGACAQRGVQVAAWAAGAWWGRPPVCSARGVG